MKKGFTYLLNYLPIKNQAGCNANLQIAVSGKQSDISYIVKSYLRMRVGRKILFSKVYYKAYHLDISYGL